jgi:spore coat polysaccharide biosynthesis protein SpsF (cytidylyltransferase family)
VKTENFFDAKKLALIIQARMSSKRLPGKMMMNIGGIPLYEYVYRRCRQSKKIENIVLSTSTHSTDDLLAQSALDKGIAVYRGSLDNVLNRYISCAEEIGAEIIVRVCGDSPFVDTALIDTLISYLLENDLDYVSVEKDRCIAGFDSEVVRLSALIKSESLAGCPEDLEHVTYYIRRNPEQFKAKWLELNMDLFDHRVSLTVDRMEDLDFCDKIANRLIDSSGRLRFDFSSGEICEIIKNSVKDN